VAIRSPPSTLHRLRGLCLKKPLKPTDIHGRPERDIPSIPSWFGSLGWDVLPHQQATWKAIAEGHSGLVVLPTGAGKTYAVFLGFLPRLSHESQGLSLLYVTPLKALTRDVQKALERAIESLAPHLKLESRTGDSSSATRQRQRKSLPQILVTTPESLALLLTYEDATVKFSSLRGIIVDEWHDLMGTKRGSLLELNLAHLRALVPTAQIWGLSATLADPQAAAQALCGPKRPAVIVTSDERRSVELHTMVPRPPAKLPWAGHLGLKMAPQLASDLSLDRSTLIFTNTRSQAERWHDALSLLMPEWEGALAIHHGSLEPKERERVERGVKDGRIRIVVCTASLDLGVDFPAVDLVVQIGSPKQLARLLQRAGRSAHRPGVASLVWFVPTHALELLEASAFREALSQNSLESRPPLNKPIDVLIQHIISRALGDGVTRGQLERELADTVGFASVTKDELSWALGFACNGGGTLASYPQYRKMVDDDGIYRVKDKMIGLRHRQNIGTIASDSSITVKLERGKTLGTLEESFLTKIRQGETFLFAGRWLTLVSIRDMTAYVRLSSRKKTGAISVWTGSSLPWSAELGRHMREVLDTFSKTGQLRGDAEIITLRPILETQKRLSHIPQRKEILLETTTSREGKHLFVFPFAGKSLHEGLGAIWTLRLSRLYPGTYSFAANDYGLEILMDKDVPEPLLRWEALIDPTKARQDLEEALHLGEMAKRQFRTIARVSGLVLQNLPGNRKSTRQLQTSSSLIFDVFHQFDPDNILLRQAKDEALELLLGGGQLLDILSEFGQMEMVMKAPPIFTPFSFPLYLERVAARISSEDIEQRIAKMQAAWVADGTKSGVVKNKGTARGSKASKTRSKRPLS
jgi:ATP-dependent Lhr-like helicase